MEWYIDLVNSISWDEWLIKFTLIDNVKVIYIKRDNWSRELYLEKDIVYWLDFKEVLETLELTKEEFENILYTSLIPWNKLDDKIQILLYSFLPFNHKYDYE